MKKEIAALSLLAALLSGGVYNTHYLCTFTGGLTDTLGLSQAYCENGEYALALDLAREAEGTWHARELYAGIFIRHTGSTRCSVNLKAMSPAQQKGFTPGSSHTLRASMTWSV